VGPGRQLTPAPSGRVRHTIPVWMSELVFVRHGVDVGLLTEDQISRWGRRAQRLAENPEEASPGDLRFAGDRLARGRLAPSEDLAGGDVDEAAALAFILNLRDQLFSNLVDVLDAREQLVIGLRDEMGPEELSDHLDDVGIGAVVQMPDGRSFRSAGAPHFGLLPPGELHEAGARAGERKAPTPPEALDSALLPPVQMGMPSLPGTELELE
jgi:hypothetical protein